MLNIFLLFVVAAGVSGQSVLKKSYNIRTEKRGKFIFSAISVFVAGLFFLAISKFELHFTWEIIPYALGFAASYGTAVLMSFVAIKLGSLSLTSLVTSYSLVIPTLYGLLFLDEKASIFFYIGLVILLASLFLINSNREDNKITLPWAIAVFLAFLGNGICSAVQNVQQKRFDGAYKSETMIIALFSVAAVMLILSLVTERKDLAIGIKHGRTHAVACGLLNGCCNLLVMLLAVRMNASLMFPVISAGGIILAGLVSVLLYKESLSKRQYLALLLGTVSVVLMNL